MYESVYIYIYIYIYMYQGCIKIIDTRTHTHYIAKSIGSPASNERVQILMFKHIMIF